MTTEQTETKKVERYWAALCILSLFLATIGAAIGHFQFNQPAGKMFLLSMLAGIPMSYFLVQIRFIRRTATDLAELIFWLLPFNW